jgi:hypothetical protein
MGSSVEATRDRFDAVMRLLFALAFLCAGCFRDETAAEPCPVGEPGCRCDDGGCNVGSQCLASIGRCVPEGCTPGTHTCTCTPENTCDGALVCEAGVCLEDEMTSATADSQASNASVTQAPSTESQTTMTTGMSDATLSTTDPPTTGSTGMPDTSSSSATTSEPDVCVTCLETAWSSVTCQDETNACLNDNGCNAIYGCFQEEGDACCGEDAMVHMLWAGFIECATNVCNAAGCEVASVTCG